jgi:alpha-tubulin suppressor-like RCC1 family protein
VPVAGGHRFRRVESGGVHTCGITDPDNLAYCWGLNDDGQLGDGTRTIRRTPVLVSRTLHWRQLTLGLTHTCGVTTDFHAYCWGDNGSGQLGVDNSKADRLRPTPVAGGHQFDEIDAGFFYTCAVTLDDRAFCWGSAGSGQLGNGKTIARFTPRAVSGGLLFARVTAGTFNTCGQTRGHQAYCWGSNNRGELGDGTNTRHLTPVAVTGGLAFGQLTAGSSFTCGKTLQDEAYCWGANTEGELGNGTTSDRNTPTPVSAP